jgi:outer membrane protein TolC
MVMAPLRSSVVEAHLEAEKLRAAGALLDLTFHTRLAFLDVQALQTKLSLQLEVLRNQQAAYATALELSKAGNLPAIELATQLAAVETSRVQVAELENAVLDAREVLNQRLGLHGARTTWTVASALELPRSEPATTDAEQRATAASLELLELSHRAESASRKVGLAKTQGWLPHLSAGVHGERDADLWEVGGHLTIGLPVFDRQQGRQLSAEGEYEAQRQRVEAAAITLRSVVRMTLNRLESASKRAHHYAERLVPAKQRQLKETVLQYNAMSLGVFQVLQTQRGVTEASIAQVDATLDYWRARAAFELLMAGRSTPLLRTMAIPSTGAASSIAAGGH